MSKSYVTQSSGTHYEVVGLNKTTQLHESMKSGKSCAQRFYNKISIHSDKDNTKIYEPSHISSHLVKLLDLCPNRDQPPVYAIKSMRLIFFCDYQKCLIQAGYRPDCML